MKASLLAGNWLLIAAAWLAVIGASPAQAQGAMDHVDLTSPRMSAAEMTRTDIESLIAAAKPGVGIDLAERSLNGLDLSGLDLSKADLTRARPA